MAQHADRAVRLTSRQLRSFNERVIGGRECGTLVIEQRAVELVGAALSDQHDLRTGSAPFLGCAACRRYAEFLQRVKGCTKHTHERIPRNRIIVIDAVNGDICLIAAPTGNRSAPTIDRGIQRR